MDGCGHKRSSSEHIHGKGCNEYCNLGAQALGAADSEHERRHAVRRCALARWWGNQAYNDEVLVEWLRNMADVQRMNLNENMNLNECLNVTECRDLNE